MIIAIGSTNRAKVAALEETIKHYPSFQEAKILSFSVPSEVADQPMSLHETIRGAKNRAKNAFVACGHCHLSFGIESGLMMVPETSTGFLESSICCIFDGKEFYFGQSCAFELPQEILNLIVKDKLDLSQACLRSGVTTNPNLGSAEGFIGILTKGRITRKEYTKQAIVTALIHVENK